MVDRITPATTDADRARIAERARRRRCLAGRDRALLAMGDRGPLPERPPALGRRSGAELVADVEPYELMKLRLLNGAHSTPRLSRLSRRLRDGGGGDGRSRRSSGFVHGLMDERRRRRSPCRPAPTSRAYKAALIERFRNPALKHRTWQIAMDGSQKLPQRLLGTIRDRLQRGAPFAAARARRRRLDALRHRHRREGQADRRARPACGEAARARRRGRARRPSGWRRRCCRSRRSSAATCRPIRDLGRRSRRRWRDLFAKGAKRAVAERA